MTLNGSMDSLLKEIDNEMEQTAAPDWKLPLQDIGDETMEMLVSHNTKENRNLRSNEQNFRRIIGSETSFPSKKTVGFSDGIELHEYDRVPEECERETQHTDVETQWRRSLPKKQLELPAESTKEESEVESEEEEDPELTIGELRQHSVADLGEKLSRMLDSNQNMYKLKLMAQEIDNRAMETQGDARGERINFTLQPTAPLVPNGGDYNQLSHFVQLETSSEPDDQEEDEDNTPGQLAHSPSRIPLTNTISINNFNLDGANAYPSTRVSSGSSYAESASDLETRTANDSFKLLEYSSDIPAALQHQQRSTDKFDYVPPKITVHPNASNAYSLATEYESARETPNSSVTDLASEVRDASVENLGIPGGLRESSPSFSEDSANLQQQQGDDTLREEDLRKNNPSLPELPFQTAGSTELDSEEEGTEPCNQTLTYDGNRNDSRSRIEYTGLHDFSSSYGSLYAGQEDKTMDENGEITPQAEWSHLTEELNASVNPANKSRASSIGSQESQGSFKSMEGASLERLPSLRARGPNVPPLVPAMESDPIFKEDPFEEIFNTSGDSLDLTRSVKPSDYISIWHSQAHDIKSHSPAFSSNSQFSQRSASSQSSTASVGRGEFKFKSRIISRCKYYNPENRIVIPSDSEDEDVIYAVDYALDPKRRNTLISKQARNNIRQNKKLNPIRAAAVTLQRQVSRREDDKSPPVESYRPIFSPSEALTELQPSSENGPDDSRSRHGAEEKEVPLISDLYEFGSYEHLAALANDVEIGQTDHPSSMSIKTEKSIPYRQSLTQENSLPTSTFLKSLPTRETPPIIVPPRNSNREKSAPILSPPPRNINRKFYSPTLAPSPSIVKSEKSSVLPSARRELSEEADESFMNEFESPPAPLRSQRAARMSSNSTHASKKDTAASIHVAENLDLSPSLPDGRLDEDFGLFLETLNRDDQSVQQSIKKREGGYNIWDEDLDLTNGTARKSSIPSEVLNKLLETESVAEDADDDQSGNSDSSQRYIKTPTDDVYIGRGLSVNGLEAVISNGDQSERNSVLFDEFHNPSLYQTPNHSPVRKTHVASPFKPVSPLKTTRSNKEIQRDEEAHASPAPRESAESEIELEPNSKLEPIARADTRATFTPERENDITDPSSIKLNTDILEPQEQPPSEPESLLAKKTSKEQKSEKDKSIEKESAKKVQISDAGNLYLKLQGVSGIKLRGIKRHKAQYAIEFDNGENVAQSPWQTLTDNGTLKLNKEFEVVLDPNPSKRGKVVITLKCRYEKIHYEPEYEEIVEKVPLPSKKKLFGKRKEQFEYQKKYVRKPRKQDDWDFIFARDGSFGRCELVLDDDFLDHSRFQCKTISLDLKNEWARQSGSPNKKPHQLPRKPPYFIGELKMEACYLARSSALEKFPKTLAVARGIVSKYKAQQNIFMEGYLLQKGGDVSDNTARRFFKLQGNQLVGYHEITRKAKIVINLLKVIEVAGPSDGPSALESDAEQTGEYQGCFHLEFANGETIMFDTEFSTDEKYDWYRKVKRVVDLNKSHQPWVKAFHETSITNDV